MSIDLFNFVVMHIVRHVQPHITKHLSRSRAISTVNCFMILYQLNIMIHMEDMNE